jgi:type IV secretory pathway VirB10-like protein
MYRIFVPLALVTGAFILGCCLGPSVPEAPPKPAAAAPSPLTQALGGIENPPANTENPATPPPAADAAGAVPAAPPVPSVPAATPAPAAPVSPACTAARAAREPIRARIETLRATAGTGPTQRLDAANAAVSACTADPDCLANGEERVKRTDAVRAAQRALDAENAALTNEEVSLYHANQAVEAACGVQ